MAATAATCRRSRAFYYPYVEPTAGHGRGLLQRLSQAACIVVTDHYPAFFIPGLLTAAARVSAVRVEAVDSNGLIPLATHGRAFTSARSFRAFVQRELRSHLREFPDEHPLRGLPRRQAQVDAGILRRWPAATRLLERTATLEQLPIDHAVPPADAIGGERAARRRLTAFVKSQLERYATEHNDPDADCTSRLSPYLHFGHISAHEVFSAVMTAERWTTRRLARRGGGAREGWWGVSDSANVFLDQLTVWRELAFNGCEWVPDYSAYESLPQWARDTIDAHTLGAPAAFTTSTRWTQRRPTIAVWNAAQRQLKSEGWFHGYLRMLWGKKLFEWAPDAPTALTWMEALMNRYSLDGRDPVSYASFAWVLGRYDRPWPAPPDFRHAALHVVRERQAQAADEEVSAEVSFFRLKPEATADERSRAVASGFSRKAAGTAQLQPQHRVRAHVVQFSPNGEVRERGPGHGGHLLSSCRAKKERHD